MRIESASTDAIDQYEELAADFIPAIFGMSRDDCFITDESRLRDFCDVFDPEPRSEIDRRILDRYRVDVSDISDGNLVAVLRAITERRPRAAAFMG